MSSGDYTDPSKIFASPAPGFDPSDNKDILEFYKNRGEEGALKEEDNDDPIEAIADQKIAALKKLRDVSPEEELRIRERVRKLESGRWLESIRSQLVGKKTVPIEYFNRLVADNESTIVNVTRYSSRANTTLQEKNAEIKQLQDKIKALEDQNATSAATETPEDQKSADAQLKQENDDLKSKLTKCQAHGAQSDAKLKELQAALDSNKTAAGSNDGADSSEHKKELQDLREQVATLQGALQEFRDTASEQYVRVQHLEQSHRDSLAREQALKDDARRHDGQVDGLQKQIDDLTRQIADAGTQDSTGAAGSSSPADDDVRRNNGRLETENGRLQREVGDLRNEVQRLSHIPATAGAAGDDDCAAKLKKLSDDLAARDKRIRELIDQNGALVAERHNWLRGIHATNPEWWNQVEAITKSKRDLEFKVIALFSRLGFDEGNLDGEAAISRLNDVLDGTPTDEESLMLTIIRFTGEVQASLRAAQTAQRRVADLQKQLERANDEGRVAESREEYLAQLKVFENEEVEKRVDARTQMYREHRKLYLGNIFGADQQLADIAAASPHGATRDAINGIRQRFLSHASLPDPPARRGGRR